MDYTWHNRWIGFGEKTGGQAVVAGFESVVAEMWNLGDFEYFTLKILSERWGLGLGGSTGAVAVVGWGFREPYELHGHPSNDWGVNISFTEKLISKGAIQSIIWSKHFFTIYKFNQVMKYRHMYSAFKDVERFAAVRNQLHWVFAALQSTKSRGVVVIDLPFAGIGLEASVYVTRGQMQVSNSSDMDLGG